MTMNRRDLLKLFGGSLVVMQSPQLLISSANATSYSKTEQPLFIWVMLRGALDSLHTVIPEFDENYIKHRPKLAKQLGTGLPLEKGFSLNPALAELHSWYQNSELLPIVAVGSGYHGRSHFDGQDFLESGQSKVNSNAIDTHSGWLGRTLQMSAYHHKAIAIDQTVPISLRGSDDVNAWYPSNAKDVGDDIYSALMNMYQDSPKLSMSLQKGLELQKNAMAQQSGKQRTKFANLTKACANLLLADNKLSCAVLELGGWDTHNNQHGRLARQLKELDDGLASLKAQLGERWQHTVVAVATEFGRTVKENGTGGSDHGSAACMLLAGGAIKGGRILGDWPGLAKSELFEGRDLMPTSNSLQWLATVLAQHWQIKPAHMPALFGGLQTYSEQLV
ncbi:DUF1501 domain-containing protein [Shewanella maritima]|uniref:DUF1501 domain-containing protein n=2 Tax=Shewanella maritima TaxID=2520507 RepID=A0A411PJ81_9GAMM|nr:DUF1501 domain-containing protein [Shewanella maritima]